jgi:hypothetical protein
MAGQSLRPRATWQPIDRELTLVLVVCRHPVTSFAQSARRPQLAAVGLASGAVQLLDLSARKVRARHYEGRQRARRTQLRPSAAGSRTCCRPAAARPRC